MIYKKPQKFKACWGRVLCHRQTLEGANGVMARGLDLLNVKDQIKNCEFFPSFT